MPARPSRTALLTPCEAIGRVTGYQGQSGSVRNPFRIPRSGKIVAFTVTLARVTPQQTDFFNGLYEARRASACRSCAGARRGGRASATG